MQQYLTVNCGSSSVKLGLFVSCSDNQGELKRIAKTVIERVDDHALAIQQGLKELEDFTPELLAGIGHRVVHGGPHFTSATAINAEVLQQIEQCIEFAPLHNPANLAGIKACQSQYDVPQVAVFDTAFHANMPKYASTYAIPADIAEEHNIRRYGFHGTSHEFVARAAAEQLGKPFEQCKLITLHLGNGASACAIKNGHSVDTTMGFTPLEGLVMGTRSGDIDPALFGILQDKLGQTAGEVDRLLNKESGLKGVAGVNDMRDLLASSAPEAQLAVDMFCYKIRKTIGSYMATLCDDESSVDAIVFTAGIGENSADIRKRCCSGLAGLGIRIDTEKNAAIKSSATDQNVAKSNSKIAILVTPTNEALMIAQHTRFNIFS